MTGSIVLTRGIPASGKSTWAKQWVAEDPANRVRLNRDDLRTMIGATDFDFATEKLVTHLQHEGARQALKAGKSVVIDDTNLRAKYVRAWFAIGPVEFRDFPIDLELAIVRDKKRVKGVGESVIRGFHQKFITPNKGSLPPIPEQEATPAVEPYVPNTDLPVAIIVDTDGTVARMDGRSPYDYTQVHTDLPVADVVALVRYLAADHQVIGVSGRPEDEAGKDTLAWWQRHGIPFDEFYFRPADRKDVRDDIIKRDIFDEHIRHNYNVVGVFDDRLRVVRMWHALGLTTYRVGDPDADF